MFITAQNIDRVKIRNFRRPKFRIIDFERNFSVIGNLRRNFNAVFIKNRHAYFAFISGFETVEIKEEKEEVLEGGIEEELSEAEEIKEPEYSVNDEEILVDEGEVVFDINDVETEEKTEE